MSEPVECLIVTAVTQFPRRCVHCGTRRGTRRERYTFERMSAASMILLYLFRMRFDSWLTVELSRCKACRNGRIDASQRSAFAMVGMYAALLGAGAVGFNGGSKVLTASLLALALAIVVVVARSHLRANRSALRVVRQEEGRLWVAGVHPDVLAKFSNDERAIIDP